LNTRNNSFLLAAILVAAAAAAAAAIAGIAANGQSAFAGGGSKTNGIVFDKNNFSNSLNINNTHFPLKPGTTFTYKGTSDGVPTKDVVVVTDKTKDIL
jgi:opacity protein-like surface antigen